MKRADQRKYHYIYKITRLDESGTYYIGMHSTDNLDDGYFGSGKRLWYSINKHGKEKHQKEILEFLPSREALKLREKELVNKELLEDVKCMNLRIGGEGGFTSNFVSEQNKRLWQIPEYRQKMLKVLEANSNNPNNKKKSSERTKIILAGLWANEYDLMIKHQIKAVIAAASPEACAKRKRTFDSINHQSGEKNSQFGTCWVTDGIKPIKIKKENLEEYLSKGYLRGRI